MKKLFTLTLLGSLSILAQTPAATAPTPRRPAIFGSQFFSVLPHVLDGGQWTTQIVVTNLGTDTENYEVDFYDEAGNPQTQTFGTTPGVATFASNYLAGQLLEGQSQVFYTASGAASTAEGWAMLNGSNTGGAVSLSEVLRNTIPTFNFVAEAADVATQGIYNANGQPGSIINFDNSNGFTTGIAFCNPDLAGVFAPAGNTIDVIIEDNTGAVLATHAYTLAPGQHQAFVLSNVWPETAGIQGTLIMIPATTTYSPLTPVAFRFLIVGMSQSFTLLPTLEYTSGITSEAKAVRK